MASPKFLSPLALPYLTVSRGYPSTSRLPKVAPCLTTRAVFRQERPGEHRTASLTSRSLRTRSTPLRLRDSGYPTGSAAKKGPRPACTGAQRPGRDGRISPARKGPLRPSYFRHWCVKGSHRALHLAQVTRRTRPESAAGSARSDSRMNTTPSSTNRFPFRGAQLEQITPAVGRIRRRASRDARRATTWSLMGCPGKKKRRVTGVVMAGTTRLSSNTPPLPTTWPHVAASSRVAGVVGLS